MTENKNSKIEYRLTYVNGLKFEIISDNGKNFEYDVVFRERNHEVNLFEAKLKANTWAKVNKRYLLDVIIYIYHDSKIVLEIDVIDYMSGKNVFINFESKALGDTIAWMPYCEEFRKKYNCNVIVSTFHNYIFEKEYESIRFVGRGILVNDIFAMFDIGWFFDKDREPFPPQTIPLQSAATNILRLPYIELRPKIRLEPSERLIQTKYVCISTHSTSNLKYWAYWQPVIDFLRANNYKVVEISKEETNYNNLEYVEDKSITNIISLLSHCDFFIGLSSGISWLAWALNKRVYMIANFSHKEHEFQSNCIRITNTNVCHGCWNNPLFKFNRGDSNWCPEHEDTVRAFECHKLIPAETVIKSIIDNDGLNNLN